ncbi:Bsc6p Ecym_2025 [Eremothecium cymbalariae DBVPG|uniref:Major facilitator superfamily (MFS) profile domain-containing protein n=1 Tax=Eremothecium cymbalariae (strain CBS 270.75 / DBVPG 7215 / KCTC 17166 / NRRL Y-17582) TaxID=931890 RepID=G8JNY4_ERECY|nr:Hypothetical protein Ecym_2025 [Eremothecium cymbalariae DBVPG\
MDIANDDSSVCVFMEQSSLKTVEACLVKDQQIVEVRTCQIEDNSPADGFYSVYKSIEYEGETVRVFPTNHKTVPLVRLQILTCFFMFMVLGINDQATGSLIPTLTKHYEISKVRACSVFICQTVSYITGSLFTGRLHGRYGARGVVLGAVTISIIFYSILALQPSKFYLYTLCYMPLGFSVALIGAMCNVVIGSLELHKNEFLGGLHAAYGISSCITPPLVTNIAKRYTWSDFFFLPLCLSIISLICCSYAFRYETRAKFNYVCAIADNGLYAENHLEEEEEPSRSQQYRVSVILGSLYLFLYLGAEIGTGSWLLTYLLECKSNDSVAMSYMNTSYWGGLTSGRIFLGWLTSRVFSNEYKASIVYGILTLFFYCIFVIVGFADTTMDGYFAYLFTVVFFAGVFIGPLFPNCSIVLLELLPKRVQMQGMGIIVALSSVGGASIPYVIGLILDSIGFRWFPVVVTFMVCTFNVIWWLYPLFIKNRTIVSTY